jgi:O-methyltransferase
MVQLLTRKPSVLTKRGTVGDPRLRNLVQRAAKRLGYRIEKLYPSDYSRDLIEIIERVRPYTMTSHERIADTCFAVDYVVENDIPGAIVECGVWKGGSMMAVALRLLQLQRTDRDLYLFDTFAGMPEPLEVDVMREGIRASDLWERTEGNAEGSAWLSVPLAEVESAISTTGYDSAHVHFVEGKVEDTLPRAAPDNVSLLRLDTDLFESTKHELEHLFPRLSVGGVLILDDYGSWTGAQTAADAYFSENNIRIMLHRSDADGRLAVKQI